MSSIKKPLDNRPLFLEVVDKMLDYHFSEGALFHIALLHFINQLDMQELSSGQFSLAIKEFYKIPIIEENIDLLSKLIQTKYEQQLTGISPSPQSRSTLSDSASEDMGDSSSDVDASSAASEVAGSASDKKVPVELEFDTHTLIDNISSWVDEHYSPVDERHDHDSSRGIRRMDSLSLLLAPHTSMSACVAVTIDLSKEPQLMIGANIDKEGTQDKIFEEIRLKLQIIQGYLAELKSIDHKTIDPHKLEGYAQELIQRLSSHTSSSLPPSLLEQAAKKIIHAVLLDDKTFNPEEKEALTNINASTIIIPKIFPADSYAMEIYATQAGVLTKKNIELSTVPRGTNIRDIHAEQLIARLLFVENRIRIDKPYTFGISKLCCGTCENYLSRHPVRFRGTHNQTYKGVVHLDTGDKELIPHQRRAITHAWRSPANSTDEEVGFRPMDYSARASAASSGFFSGGAEKHTVEPVSNDKETKDKPPIEKPKYS